MDLIQCDLKGGYGFKDGLCYSLLAGNTRVKKTSFMIKKFCKLILYVLVRIKLDFINKTDIVVDKKTTYFIAKIGTLFLHTTHCLIFGMTFILITNNQKAARYR